ncbi:chondroitin sulfate proteoglycan 5 isoform X5 [Clupea harengus]|uniref:Chondroitin sulfate proteoglycan 5 isoform X5 n=1 Tax=Clupea harengus TaxID=7950 RepID=A0A6P8FVV9_CLUHA|nr:chondroitin sulfate proteoglycan 5 isoform X5 [Clupea harengus]
MNGKVVYTGCWRLPALAFVVILHLIPLFAHGNSIGANVTVSPDTAVNVTLPLSGDEGEKMADLTRVVDADSQRAGRKPRDGEGAGSGMMGGEGFPVAGEEETGAGGRHALSPDSAETDHLLPHSPGNTQQELLEEDEDEGRKLAMPTDAPWQSAKGALETTVFDLDREFTPTTTQSPVVRLSNSDTLTVDFMDSDSRDLETPAPSAHELQGRDPTSWTMPDNYDYLTPYDDSISPSPDEYSDTTTTDLYDDDITTTPPPRPYRPRIPIPGLLAPDGPLTSGAGAEDPAPPPGVADGTNGSDCRNGSCKSPCDQLPNYCSNGGQCFFVDGTGPFCRCNVQEYVWNKGARCESVITEFQVMCIAIGASAVMLLLLFMIIVCFAKQLHVLKTENNKLRKRSKYRPSSEQHNDNFSLSTIAEGSHPNKTMSRYTWECKNKEDPDCEDDPHAQNKLEDSVKAPPPKEDESLNIQNSLTPKQENHKGLGDENSSEVNSLQNNMM